VRTPLGAAVWAPICASTHLCGHPSVRAPICAGTHPIPTQFILKLPHLYTVYMACAERLLTRLNPLAERTCFAQVGRVVGSALSARDMRLPYAGPAAPEPSTILGTGLALAQPTRCSFPVVLSRVFFPGCSFPGVPSWVFFPGCSFHSPTGVLSGRAIHRRARESHPQSLRAPVCSFAPSVARQLRPLWHVICALCGKSSVPFVARHLCPLWQVIGALCGTSSGPLWHVICALCGTSSMCTVRTAPGHVWSGPGSNRSGVQGAHLQPLGFFLNPLGLFLRAFIPFIWRVLSAFLRA
jgi:hypothetical protein